VFVLVEASEAMPNVGQNDVEVIVPPPSRPCRAPVRRQPKDVNWSQRRVARIDQHPVNMPTTKHTTPGVWAAA